jgi:hypothetical protein
MRWVRQRPREPGAARSAWPMAGLGPRVDSHAQRPERRRRPRHAEPEDHQQDGSNTRPQAPIDTDGESEHSDRHEEEVGTLNPTPISQFQFAARVVDRVVAGTTRSFDEQDDSEDDGRADSCLQQCLRGHFIIDSTPTATAGPCRQ